MNDIVRVDIEKTIKEFSLDRNRVFEVTKQKYEQILRKIEQTFVYHEGTIHWANMGDYNPALPVWYKDCRDNMLWFEDLDQIIPHPESAVYVLFEESRQRAKYWVFEMYLEELKVILGEAECYGDYYIVSKKYEWLISENHHAIVSIVGDCLDLSTLKGEGLKDAN